MITPKEFKTMQDSARCLIQIVFEYEKQFKDDFITPYCKYQEEEYELDRVHLSGTNMRITLRFDDYSETSIYRDLTEVIEWYYNLAEKVTNKGVK